MISEIENCEQLAAEVKQESGETVDRAKRSQLIRKAIELGCVDEIPDDWGLDVE